MVYDNHMELWTDETYIPREELQWYNWIGNVERATGLDPDGDLAEDGYSMDSFYLMFEQGWSVTNAVIATKADHENILRCS